MRMKWDGTGSHAWKHSQALNSEKIPWASTYTSVSFTLIKAILVLKNKIHKFGYLTGFIKLMNQVASRIASRKAGQRGLHRKESIPRQKEDGGRLLEQKRKMISGKASFPRGNNDLTSADRKHQVDF